MFGFMKREDINKGIDDVKVTAGAVLLDVRTKDEYRNGHVPGSKNIDVGEIEKTSSIVTDRTTPLFVYCLSGARSGRAVSALKNIGGISSYTGPVERKV